MEVRSETKNDRGNTKVSDWKEGDIVKSKFSGSTYTISRVRVSYVVVIDELGIDTKIRAGKLDFVNLSQEKRKCLEELLN